MLPQILGCYQSRKREKMGKSGTGRDFTQRIEWLVLRLDTARFLIFPLDDARLPMERFLAGLPVAMFDQTLPDR